MDGRMDGYCSKICVFAVFTYIIPVSFEAIARGVPCDLGTKFGLKN